MKLQHNVPPFIVSAGVDSIWLELNDIPYKSLFQDVKTEIDILHFYGNSWNKANYDYIKDVLEKKRNITIRVILLSLKSKLISELYELHRKDSEEKLYHAMLQSIEYWIDFCNIAEKTIIK